MSVPEKINDFLLARAKRAYCDGCIQERLGLKWRQQVQLVTSTLAVTSDFTRENGICCNCQEQKQVVRATTTHSHRQAAPSAVVAFPKMMRLKTGA